jgi:hypothetical protein
MYKSGNFSGLTSTASCNLGLTVAVLLTIAHFFITSPNPLTSVDLAFYRFIYQYLYSGGCATPCVYVPIFFLLIRDV